MHGVYLCKRKLRACHNSFDDFWTTLERHAGGSAGVGATGSEPGTCTNSVGTIGCCTGQELIMSLLDVSTPSPFATPYLPLRRGRHLRRSRPLSPCVLFRLLLPEIPKEQQQQLSARGGPETSREAIHENNTSLCRPSVTRYGISPSAFRLSNARLGILISPQRKHFAQRTSLLSYTRFDPNLARVERLRVP